MGLSWWRDGTTAILGLHHWRHHSVLHGTPLLMLLLLLLLLHVHGVVMSKGSVMPHAGMMPLDCVQGLH